MPPPDAVKRYLILGADDFGRSAAVNRAVETAHQWGMLTSVSIIASGDAFRGAVELASTHPRLSVGLHIMLSEGRSVLPPSRIPDIVGRDGFFERTPFRAGLRYWRQRRRVAGQMEAEIEAQFDLVERAGIHPTHVDGHHHLHMHPAVFDIVARQAAIRGITWIRVPREPLSFVLGHHFPLGRPKALIHWIIFGLLARRDLKVARALGMRAVDEVYGLSGTGGMNEGYLLALLPHVRSGMTEVYLHPDMRSPSGREEIKCLTSPRVRERMSELGLAPVGFRELLAPRPNVRLLARNR